MSAHLGPLLAEHARKPRNMGRLSEATAVGNVGSITVGRALRFFIHVDAGLITQAKFQVFACPEMIPTASLLTELVTGMSVNDARRLQREDIVKASEAGDLAVPLLPWSLEALQQALRLDAGEEAESPPVESDETLICRCHNVSEATIRLSIEGGAEEVEDVVDSTKAGSGCGSCKRDIDQIFQSMMRGANRTVDLNASSDGQIEGRVPTMKKIMAACDSLIAEAQQAGGKLELWDFAGGKVSVKLSGAVAEDGPVRKGLLEKLDRKLKDDVDPTLGVEVVA